VTRFPLAHLVPPELTPYILDIHWSGDLLHALDLPTTGLPLADLAHHLDFPFWAYAGRPFQLNPHEVAADPVTYQDQYERTLTAGLQYPLDVLRHPDDRLTILDGVHRLLRAELEGRLTVNVRILPWNRLDEIAAQ
jgi:hypothetical protein